MNRKRYLIFAALLAVNAHRAGAEITLSHGTYPEPKNSDRISKWEGSAVYRNVSIKTITPVYGENDFTHEFDLTLVSPRGTQWTEAQIDEHVLKLAKTYQQCKIKVRNIAVISADVPAFMLDMNDTGPGHFIINSAQVAYVSSMPEAWPKPVVFLTDGYAATWAYSVASAKRTSELRGRDYNYLANTAFISSEVNLDWYELNGKDKTYSALPHELAHIFNYMYVDKDGKEDTHSRDNFNNLMNRDTTKENDYLAPYMCDIFKASPLMRQTAR
jgi:hypothetical protein